MSDRKQMKKIEQAEYRAKIAEQELNAVKSSKAYRAAKVIGSVKKQITKDPIGLTKKVARIALKEPAKLKRIVRIANRSVFMAQSVAEQTARYQEWILLNEPDEAELDAQRTASEKLAYKPLISIVTPVFNPPNDVLEELIESVLEQTYPHFELYLGNFGDSQDTKDLIAKYVKLDKRVKTHDFADNIGIAGNSNQILERVTGEFIALLDHDDTLSHDALYENAVMLNDKPYDFLYSDKDKIDEAGHRFEPLFKPQLSPEMLLNINYLTHLNVMRTSIVRDIGGWDSETDGAQDWDLFLRVVAAAKHVGHVPKILYHWRVIATSTAMSIETKPYALAGQRRAIDKYLQLQDISAQAYHDKTELFIKWDGDQLDRSPLIFVHYSSLANTARLIRQVGKVAEAPEYAILFEGSDAEAAKIQAYTGSDVVAYVPDTFTKVFAAYIKKRKAAERTVLFMRDDVRLPRQTAWYENLTGWLLIKQVGAVSGRLVDRHDLIIDSAGVITPSQDYYPLFYKFPRFYQSYLGNAEWVRNVSMISNQFSATRLSALRSFDFSAHKTAQDAFDAFFTEVSRKSRLVMSPHATASIYETTDTIPVRPLKTAVKKKGSYDVFANPNMSADQPLRLFEDELLAGIPNDSGDQEPIDRYQHDAVILAGSFDITEAEMAASRVMQPLTGGVKTVAWVLPSYDAVYAGLNNIFSFADYLCTTKGIKTTFYILKSGHDAKDEKKLAEAAFAGLSKAEFIAMTPDQTERIGQHDIGIATQWATAYPLAKAPGVKQKYYFIQDNEVNFYPKGTISALVELSYRFGFKALAGTEGLLDMYRRNYGGDGIVLGSKVDLTAYTPRKDLYYTPHKPYKVFFYARPNMPRNAFELGIAGLKKLKQQLGDDVEIITAGAAWNPDQYGVGGMFNNLGKIQYAAVPKLYRSVDAGLMFMFSGHPGVTASELMASGCPVVVNEYDDTTWNELYQHEKTCLITQATASEVARNLERCLTEKPLRKKLIDGGLAKAADFYTGYEASLEDAYRSLGK